MGRIESMEKIRFKQTLRHVFRSEVAIPERLLTSIQKCVNDETKECITRKYRVGDDEEEVRMLLENGMFIDDFTSEMLGKTILHRVRRMKEKQRKIFGELG